MSTSSSGLSSVVPEVFTASVKSTTAISSKRRMVYFPSPSSDSPHSFAASFQGPNGMDAILQYPQYNALVNAFALPGAQNMSQLADMVADSKAKFAVCRFFWLRFEFLLMFVQDPGVLGNFVENQDLPRWNNLSVDPQSLWNALTFNFMSDGYVCRIYACISR